MGQAKQRPLEEPSRRGAPSWTLTKGTASGVLVLRFVGPTATREIPEFLGALSRQLPARDAHLVFDLRELVGHNVETRVPIQRWLSENRPRIAHVTVVVKKVATILKMATSVVALATGLDIEIQEHLEGEPSRTRLRAVTLRR